MNRVFAIVGSLVVAGLAGSAPPALAQLAAARPVSDGQARGWPSRSPATSKGVLRTSGALR